MNTGKMVRRRPGGRMVRRWARWPGLASLLVVGGLMTGAAFAQSSATVDTIAGGRTGQNPNHYGNADGDTAQVAQFNTPSGLAIHPSGNFLFVADTGNGSIRQLDLPGNRTTTIITNLLTPVDVVMDAETNLYVLTQGDGRIRKYDRFMNLVATNNATLLSTPTAFALDASTNFYVVELGGALKRVNGTNGVVTTVVAAGTFVTPQGVVVLDSGFVLVSDTGNHVIRSVQPVTLAIATYAGVLGSSGTNNGPVGLAKLNSPHGLSKAGNGVTVVADYGNHMVRKVDSAGVVTLIYGIPSSQWFTNGAPGTDGVWPGWSDGSAQFAESREPDSVLVDGGGNVYATEQYYHLIRKATGTGLTGPSGVANPDSGGGGVVVNPPSLSVSPNAGYFPMGQSITVASSSTQVYYTTDGSEPTTNSPAVTMSGGLGTILWTSPTNDLTALRVSAFTFSGTNFAVSNIIGQASSTNILGVPPGINTNIVAGVGSTIAVPIVINLRTNDRVRSLQFRVEITPGDGATPMISNQFRALNITSNDFISVVTSDSAGGVSSFATESYSIGTTRGLKVSFIATNSGLSVSRFAVIAMLAVPIPTTVAEGKTYSIDVLQISGTSDGQQATVPIASAGSRTITVANRSYIVGDTSPAGWYNAGDFGTGNLNNNDVNNAFYASLGIKQPYTFTDVFDAMDAFPVDVAGGPTGGDGSIGFLDWQTIYNRSLRLDTNNWSRSWSSTGVRTNTGATLNSAPLLPGTTLTATPGSVWVRQAAIGALPVERVAAGATVNVPVYARVASDATVAGLQFRAVVQPEGDAPPLTQQARFVAALANAVPAFTGGRLNEAIGAWNLGALSFGGSSSNLLGYVQFAVPAGAQSGQLYTVYFANADGAPNLSTQYYFETRPAAVWVGTAAQRPAELISEEWKTHFFGSVTAADADPDADPDGDGVPNWQEYLAGTHPVDPGSRLHFASAEARSGGREVALQLLTAPGKVYVLESSASLGSGVWTTVATFTGDGNLKEFVETNTAGGALFYRIRISQ